MDFDLASPPRLGKHPGGTLDERLRAAGFVVHASMDPVVLRYQDRRFGERDLAPIHFEFLTGLPGPTRGRQGKERRTREIQKGLPAQALRYLDLLAHEPLTVSTSGVPGLRGTARTDLRLPNPASYILQKALLRGERGAKSAKDLAYIHDVAVQWTGREPEVLGMTRSLASASPTWAKWMERGKSTLDAAFFSPAGDGPVSIELEMRHATGSPRISAGGAFRVVRPFLEGAMGVRVSKSR